MNQSIHPDTTIGPVHLAVADLDRSLRFYREAIGLQQQRRDDNRLVLGAGDEELLILSQKPGARPARGVTGLYHFAILVPTRKQLALSLRHLVESQTPLQGLSDHLVSEAIYLADPDGNGIEIYRDRPRPEWPTRNGQIEMSTAPLDVASLQEELAGSTAVWEGLPATTRIGHIHLHVGRLDEAEAFYRDLLGFDLILRYGSSASFLSAGGYHHHIGLNTWAGVGAPPPPPDAAGLRWYTIVLPDTAALAPIVSRIDQAGYEMQEVAQVFRLRDPAHNGIILTARASSRATTIADNPG